MQQGQPSPVRTASPARMSQDEFPFTQEASSSSLPGSSLPPSTPKSTCFTSSSPSALNRSISLFGATGDEIQRHVEDQKSFGDKRETLVSALDSTTGLVKGLAAFNQEKWTIHYPHQLGLTTTAAAPNALQRGTSSPPATSPAKGARPSAVRRSASMFAEEPAEESSRPAPQRSYSTAEGPVKPTAPVDAPPVHPLSILSLDLKLGHPTAPTANLPALLPSLSLATLSQLLSRRLTSAVGHIGQLRQRVTDTNSRILVTGDLNAGKSTLVNALLRREVMPSDQQPCTTVFCEVLDASAWNEGKEELHAVRDVEKYDAADRSTFDAFDLSQVLEVQDMEESPYQIVKAYVHDARAPAEESNEPNPSFIKNGLVSISLIDAPGLNRDTLSTTALFARQSEIDVIVFVVSAENHFTLSAKEFLWNASREKAYVFIVVNKWAGIRDKARCMRVVGEQIKQLSPATWKARQELVHFVDAAEVVDDETEEEIKSSEEEATSFDHLEQSLRSFVLLKRTTSKLAPAKHYLLNLLADLSTLASTNVIAASDELAEALRQLQRVKPIHERLAAQRDEVEEGVDRVEESVVEVVRSATWSRLERAMGYVSQGQVVPPQEATPTSLAGAESLKAPTELPEFPGVMGLWEWASEVKATLVRALEAEVRSAEDEARGETVEGVKKVQDGLGEKYLSTANAGEQGSEEVKEGEKKAERVFRPEVMFAKRRRGLGRLAARGQSTGLGLGSTAVGLSNSFSATDFEVTMFDLLDLQRLYAHGNRLRGKKAITDGEDGVETSAILGLGLGSLGMVGSRVIGIKGTMDSLTRIMEMLGSEKARKWAGPVLGVLTVGFVAYIIVDLPRAVPRNIGRKLQASLSSSLDSSSTATPPITFPSAHSDRIAKETRKVLRLAGWDLRERFRAALERSEKERKEVEATVEKAEGALKFLGEFVEKVEKEETRVEEVAV
ncbi:hypothetical protein BCR35DRAFT_281434 [Leucosporidium creatinivorum]|uniref:Dynamin-type G domain-containing protein n=1 Tax=Leucosporidium creatinivorum TaxID=106004 RepID=A0A1Y2EQM7_9BASI|nr:hypothetical protein BCR35DRAFT_281434 [Leucosporidium creatinivorum]